MDMKTNKSLLYITLFLVPAVVIITVYYILPLIFISYTSLSGWKTGSFLDINFIGLGNYTNLFSDNEYWMTILRTFIWILCGVLIQLPLALITAILLHRKPFGWKIFRVAYFFPQIIASICLGYMWYFMYKQDIGIINNTLRLMGLEDFTSNWLGTSQTAFKAVIFSWLLCIGYYMIIYLSQIGTIPNEMYEAAIIDGANVFQTERYITIPMLSKTIISTVLLMTTWGFKAFEVPFTLTNGGPGTSSEILPIMMYKYFLDGRSAVCNALGVTMVGMGIFLILLVNKINKFVEE